MPNKKNISVKLLINSNADPKLYNFLEHINNGGKSARQMLCKRAERALSNEKKCGDIDDFAVQYFSNISIGEIKSGKETFDFTYYACINRVNFPKFSRYCDGYTAKNYAILALFAYLCEDKDMFENGRTRSTGNDDSNNNSTTPPLSALDHESDKSVRDNIIENPNTLDTNDSNTGETDTEKLVNQWQTRTTDVGNNDS